VSHLPPFGQEEQWGQAEVDKPRNLFEMGNDFLGKHGPVLSG